MKQFLIDVVRANPISSALIAIAIVAVIGISAWIFIPSWVHEIQADRHAAKQEEIHTREDQLTTDAEGQYRGGQVQKEEATKADERFKKEERTVREKKDHAKKLEKKIDTVGNRTIDDADVPGDRDLCAKARAAGIRCDIP